MPKAAAMAPRGGYFRYFRSAGAVLGDAASDAAVPGRLHGRLGAAAQPARATPPGQARRRLHHRPHPSRTPRHRRHLRRRREVRGHAGAARLDQHSSSRQGDRAAGAGVSAGALRRQHRALQFDGRAGHRLPPGSGRLRQRSAADADDLRAAAQGARPAAGRGVGHRDQQVVQPDGRQQAARLRRSVLRQRHPAEAAAAGDDQVGGEHRRRTRRRRSPGARRAHDGRARRRLRRLRLARVRLGPRARRRAQGDAWRSRCSTTSTIRACRPAATS